MIWQFGGRVVMIGNRKTQEIYETKKSDERLKYIRGELDDSEKGRHQKKILILFQFLYFALLTSHVLQA